MQIVSLGDYLYEMSKEKWENNQFVICKNCPGSVKVKVNDPYHIFTVWKIIYKHIS